MIRTLHIPREHWVAVLELLNRQVGGRTIRIEVLDRTNGDQEVARQRPLRVLDAEREAIVITFGDEGGEVTHRIDAPVQLYLAQTDRGEVEWLAIEDEAHTKTLVHFEHLPELEHPATHH